MPGEASAVKQIRAAGLDMPLLGDEDLDGDYWKEAVPGLSDVYYSTYASIYGDDPDDQVNEWSIATSRRRARSPTPQRS